MYDLKKITLEGPLLLIIVTRDVGKTYKSDFMNS